MVQSIRRLSQLALCAALAAGAVRVAAQPAPAASCAKVKELVELMKGKKLEAFAMRESMFESRFVATMVTPDVQTLLVSALYSRPTDIDYWIYQKDYNRAYGDLVSGALGSERFLVEDVLGDGLMAVPGKNGVADSVAIAGVKQLFEGPADPKGRNAKKPLTDVYMKSFADADARYARLLDILIAQLKAGKVLAAPIAMR
jgi:hypothetical protein